MAEKEFERYAFVDEATHDRVADKLSRIPEADFQPGNRVSYFFPMPEANISIADKPDGAMVKLKDGQIGQGAGFGEHEYPISKDDVATAVRVFAIITDQEPQISEQFRWDASYMGVEIALKYTQTWGFHIELERLLPEDATDDALAEAERQVQAVATDLGVTIATDEELNAFRDEFEATGEGRGEYTSDEFRELYGTLFKLAAINQLPHTQHMDQATVDWLRSNEPAEHANVETTLIELPESLSNVLKKSPIVIPSEWLGGPDREKSIHGQLHAQRTAILSAHAAQRLGATDTAVEAAFVAGLLHDIGREHDKHDENHGAKGVDWLGENYEEVCGATRGLLNDANRDAVEFAMIHHDSEQDLEIVKAPQESVLIARAVRAGDALDRYRLPKLRWWPDESRLPDELTLGDYRMAYEMVLESEQMALSEADTHHATQVLTEEATHHSNE